MSIPLPTYDQVRELPEHLRTTVGDDRIDENGHMNVRHYFDLQITGVDVLWREFGVDESYPLGGLHAAFTLNHFLTYVNEVMPGEEISVHARLVERSDKVVHLMGFMLNETTRKLAHVIEILGASIDLPTRRIGAFPPHVRSEFDRILAEHDTLSWPSPVSGALAVRR